MAVLCMRHRIRSRCYWSLGCLRRLELHHAYQELRQTGAMHVACSLLRPKRRRAPKSCVMLAIYEIGGTNKFTTRFSSAVVILNISNSPCSGTIREGCIHRTAAETTNGPDMSCLSTGTIEM